MIAQDSAKFWLPKIQADPWLNSMIPNTLMAPYSEEFLEPSLKGKPTKEYSNLYYAVADIIRLFIGYPAFIRTDITSAKHAGKKAWCIEREDDLNHALLTTLSASHLKTYFQKIKATHIMVRPLLHLKYERTAFHGLPVAKEWRVFSTGKFYQCLHGYWPTEALAGHMDDGQAAPSDEPNQQNWAENWVSSEVTDAAARAASLMGGGKWSIDFAEGEDGKIWLLDMATAGNSYHRDGCQYKGLDKENEL